MSADNWRICPRCYLNHELRLEKREAQLSEAYGAASQDHYLKILEEVKELEQIVFNHDLEQTFREDFEIGMEEDGNFYIRYKGECHVCNFKFRFTKDQQIDIVGE